MGFISSLFGGLFGGGKSKEKEQAKEPAKEQARETTEDLRRRRARGMRSTIATSPLGVAQQGNVLKKTLG